MTRWNHVGFLGTAVALLAMGCSAPDARDVRTGEENIVDGVDPEVGELPQGESDVEGTSLDELFASAADTYGIPVVLLKSIAWSETRWHMMVGQEEFDGHGSRHGIMAIHDSNLDEAAMLVGVSVEEIMTDPASNIAGGAALLDAEAADESFDRTDAGAWAPVVARASGIQAEAALSSYIHEEVYATMAEGVSTELAAMEAVPAVPEFPLMAQQVAAGPDYAPAKWRPSPNNSSRPSGTAGDVQMVIIHTCEGGYSGCWGHLTTSGTGVSAHYVVNSSGSEISQLVRENRKAWHIGASYKCSLNDNTKCNLNNVGSNAFTVGIEHAGSASQSSWSPGLLTASTDLTCDISRDHNIPRDEWHIVGHGQLQPFNRTDPGANWPWTQYINMVNESCGDPGGGGGGGGGGNDPPPPDGDVIVVDSNNGANASNAEIVVSGNWRASSNVAGFFNTGYWWRTTGATSDAARFRAFLGSAKRMQVQAWWSSANDRSSSAPFVIIDANGNQLDVVRKNQKQNGGQWVTIGTYDFPAGWNTVALSRWTTPGDVVVADAVRFREVN